MTQAIMLIPVDAEAGLLTITLGLLDVIQSKKIKVSFLQPLEQSKETDEQIQEQKSLLKSYRIRSGASLSLNQMTELLSQGRTGKRKLLTDIVEQYSLLAKDSDIVVVKGLMYLPNQPYALVLNLDVALALDAKIVLVANARHRNLNELEEVIKINLSQLFCKVKDSIIGCFINQSQTNEYFSFPYIRTLGVVPWQPDFERNKKNIHQHIAYYIDKQWIRALALSSKETKLSSAVFFHQIIERAREAKKTIVLPEGEELRTIKAAALCSDYRIATCVLLGNKRIIQSLAKEHHIQLGNKVKIIDPDKVRKKYVAPMVELRRKRHLSEEMALELLKDNLYLGTMMLHMGEVDGFVSGATHTTAETVRPAFQLIKTAPHAEFISSVFLMCFPDQVLVFSDCAVYPKPNTNELAEIAIHSADTARFFGIEPRVAMISYSTGGSGFGSDVNKVRRATKIVREKRPDILIEGPIQYDAAVDEDIARRKGIDSLVGGYATVFVFSDLDTGNAVYKAVQRSTDILCLGPVLQGMRKPVNDLSRGCLAEDIVYTIACTAVQASV